MMWNFNLRPERRAESLSRNRARTPSGIGEAPNGYKDDEFRILIIGETSIVSPG